MCPSPRRGFSLIELVVVLFVIAVLFALFMPWTASSRPRVRQVQCLNNLRNVGLATLNYATQSGSALPPLEDGAHPWPRMLLRTLDQPALDRKITAGESLTDEELMLQVFTCPDDDDSYFKAGGLSYVVSGGFGFFPVEPKTGEVSERGRHSLAQDWDGDGEVSEEDRRITRATGVFWRPDDVVPALTLDDIAIGDGTGHTLLLTENLKAGPWTSRETRELAFVIGRERLTFGGGGALDVIGAELGPFGINGVKEAAAPAPSSHHSGTVNVIFADGHGRSVAETMEPLVYVRLLTSGGAYYGEAPVSNDDYGY